MKSSFFDVDFVLVYVLVCLRARVLVRVLTSYWVYENVD
jgi:hypothetical protein